VHESFVNLFCANLLSFKQIICKFFGLNIVVEKMLYTPLVIKLSFCRLRVLRIDAGYITCSDSNCSHWNFSVVILQGCTVCVCVTAEFMLKVICAMANVR